MKYKYILFDLDGTLTDPKIGITKSVQFALLKKDIIVESLDDLETFIGPPLIDSFMTYFDFTKEEAIKAVEDYREYFSVKGIFENTVYSGIESLLKNLKKQEVKLAVATSKPTVFANQVLEHFELDKFFDLVIGSNLDGSHIDKDEIVSTVIKKLNILDTSKAIMIGDREYDIMGGKKNNMDTIGVLYGYGIGNEIEKANPTHIVKTVREIEKYLI